MPDKKEDLCFDIPRLGECRIPSPMQGGRFVPDDARVVYSTDPREIEAMVAAGKRLPSMEVAGPREKIFFDPARLKCGVVTCGGLCPGLNDVIRALVLSLHYHYGVNTIYGFRYGYEGLVPRCGHKPLELTLDAVDHIHESGGTLLASSRGPQDPKEIVDYLEHLGIGALFTIGGDGTLRGAAAIADEACRRGFPLSVIGIPKTIDNDICYVQSSFGFETAVSEAWRAVYAAHAEAKGVRNGIGLVKLMGRESGFIAAYVVLADSQVNFCLVPEVPFRLERFLEALEHRIVRRGHAVIVVAEGAGQEMMKATGEHDASGNTKLGDIGIFLRDAIKSHFARRGIEMGMKYIDPSYMIRSLPANPHDSAFCLLLGHNAVHAAMVGRTRMVVGQWNQQFTHVPIRMATSRRKKIDPEGWVWSSVMASTGQPRDMT